MIQLKNQIKKSDSILNRSFFIVILFLFMFVSMSSIAFADGLDLKSGDEQRVKELHEKMDSVSHLDNGWLYQDIVRWVGWGFIKMQIWLVDYIEDGVNGILQWNAFYSSSGVSKLVEQLTPYVMGLFLLSLIYLGFQFMTNKIEKRDQILMNVLLAFGFIFLIPALMPYLDDVMKVGVDQLKEGDDQHLSTMVVKKNVADIKYYVDSGFDFNRLGLPIDKTAEKGQRVGTIDYDKANKIRNANDIAITEKLDLQSEEGWFGWWSKGYKKELEKNNALGHDFLITQLVPDGEGGKRLKELAPNKIPTTALGQEAYYRYHVNWGTIIFSLGVVGLALAITVIKMARVIFDLGFHAIFAPFVAATDLTGGQRIKKMATEIVSSFAVLFVMVLILKLFTMYVNWVVGLMPTVGSIIGVLMLIAGAWALIDAPDIVQRLLGIDAGLRSGWQAMMGAYAGAKMAGAGLKGLSKGAGAVGKGLSGVKEFGKGLGGAKPTKSNNRSNGVKQMPSSGGFGDGMDLINNNESGEDVSPINKGENERSEGEDTQKSIPDSDNFINSHNNPYSKGYGLYSGSRRGQEMADFKARAYNSGVNARQKLSAGASTLGNVAMTGARFMRHPIQSTKNIGAMGMTKASNIAGQMKKSIKAMPSKVSSGVSNIMSQTSMPIGQNSIGTVTDTIDKAMQEQTDVQSAGGTFSPMIASGGMSAHTGRKITAKGINKHSVKRMLNTRGGGSFNIQTPSGTQATVHVPNQNTQSIVTDDVQVAKNTQVTMQDVGAIPPMIAKGGMTAHTGRKITVKGVDRQTIKHMAKTRAGENQTVQTSVGHVNIRVPKLQDDNVSD